MTPQAPYPAALSLYSQGAFAQALAVLDPLIQPADGQEAPPEALNLAAVCLRRLGRPQDAEALLRRLIAAMPAHADAHCNLGNLLRDQGRAGEAQAAYEHALALQPGHVQALENLGPLLKDLGRLPQAEDCFKQLLQLRPGNAQTHYLLGLALQGQKRPQEAEAAYQQAVALAPELAAAHLQLGILHYESGRLPQAEAAYRRVLASLPDEINALNNLGTLLMDEGLVDEGLALYRRAVACAPDHPANLMIHSNLAYTLAFQAEEGKTILEECRHWSARHETPLRSARQPHHNDRDPQRRLRIGYVSPDFRKHCQTLFTVPLLAHHDHARFEIFCYASVPAPDHLTRHLMRQADVWRDVHALDDEQLAQRIREDRIDILVDLTLHMVKGRPLLFARKPAPVQIAWLAYPGTTGIEAMDYRLTDPWLDPPGTDDQYTERSIRLPDAFWCYDPLTDEATVNELPARTAGHISFGSLNSRVKISDRTLRMWAAVLDAVPHAQLLLLARPDTSQALFVQRLQAQGIDMQRVRFIAFRPRTEYLRVYHEIDIALDTFPCNGHTTSMDAFWMGVPVVSRVGHTAVGRGGLSLLMNLGLGELAAHSDEEFVAIAVRLANDLPHLAQLRQELRPRMENSPLMDGARFARSVETVYRQIWQEKCQETPSMNAP